MLANLVMDPVWPILFCCCFFPTSSFRTTMTQWSRRAPSRASLPTWCHPTRHCTACRPSPPPRTWDPAPSRCQTPCRATPGPSATGSHGPWASPCSPVSVPLPLPPSRSALPYTNSSPCTRAPFSTSQSACSRSSHSQSSHTRWGCSPPSTPRLPGSRWDPSPSSPEAHRPATQCRVSVDV